MIITLGKFPHILLTFLILIISKNSIAASVIMNPEIVSMSPHPTYIQSISLDTTTSTESHYEYIVDINLTASGVNNTKLLAQFVGSSISNVSLTDETNNLNQLSATTGSSSIYSAAYFNPNPGLYSYRVALDIDQAPSFINWRWDDFGLSAQSTISAVPIPAAAWLFGSGLIGLIAVARRKKV